MSVVVANVLYHCGCGFRTDVSSEAIEHCRKTGHVLTASGSVYHVEPKRRRVV